MKKTYNWFYTLKEKGQSDVDSVKVSRRDLVHTFGSGFVSRLNKMAVENGGRVYIEKAVSLVRTYVVMAYAKEVL